MGPTFLGPTGIIKTQYHPEAGVVGSDEDWEWGEQIEEV
jgi:hypothetical protein